MPLNPARISRFLTRWLDCHPESEAQLNRAAPVDDPVFSGLPDSADDPASVLRDYRNAEMARIAWRDLRGLDTLDDTLTALSLLADRCIQAALRCAEARIARRYGQPLDARGETARLVIIGMGKLGGYELNFSSDIDLIFTYRTGYSMTPDADLDVAGYFRRVAQKTIQLLAENTADGFVYRVDTRLRPFGDAGALVASIASMEQYYQAYGREWERYAWIKARPVAGDMDGGQQLIHILRPFVYRRYLDYGAFESLRRLKTVIDGQVVERDLEDNIKLGYGGIREIEFLAQAFQLVRGGQETSLQSNRLRPTLAHLAEAGHIQAETARRLDQHYVYLRRLENRLQMLDDQQTHTLPTDEADLTRLAESMALVDSQALIARTQTVRYEVHELFERIFAVPEPHRSARVGEQERRRLVSLWQGATVAQEGRDLLERYGITHPDTIMQALADLRGQRRYHGLEGSSQRWLDDLVPSLILTAARHDDPERAILRVLEVVRAIIGRSTYLAFLVEYPAALGTLSRLCVASDWITWRIANQPALLDSLLDPRQLYHPPRRAELEEDLGEELQQHGPHDLETQMDVIRRFTHKSMLSIAAADVTRAMPLMIVSDHLTVLAEVVLEAALDLAWQQMTRRYGEPLLTDGSPAPFLVVGYGKLGGLELGYNSDLDLVFIYDSPADCLTEGGRRELTHQVFFTRLAQRLIHILSTTTPAGQAYDVDIRLRPSGDAGLMISHLDSYRHYLKDKAWIWEHQALVRARPIAGDRLLAARFAQLRLEVLGQQRDPARLRSEVVSMRDRIRREKDRSTTEARDIKQVPGGLIDIEFMAQFAVLAYGYECPELIIYSDAIRILETMESGQLASYAIIRQLTRAYRDYRRVIHSTALQREQAMMASNSRWEATRQAVQVIWQNWLADDASLKTNPTGADDKAGDG